MKKIYAFLAAALISVCAFASKDVVPADEAIKNAAEYNDGEVCVAIFVPADMACNDIVFVGTYNNWGKGEGKVEDAKNCKKFVAIDGFDGWYAVSVADENASPEGKPLMLDVDGNFNWAYQIGEATIIRGGVTVVSGLPGEIDLKTYGKDAPNVYTVEAWKSNPCTAIYHNYKITVISDGCEGFAVPFLVGDMTNWQFVEMQLDVDQTMANMAPTYYITFKAAEGTKYQLTSGLQDGDSIPAANMPGWKDAAYLQKLVGEDWVRMPGEDGDNLLTKENPEILFDIREADLRWARCAPDEREDVVVTFIAPAGAPEAVEIIGSFDDWAGTAMTLVEEGKYTATIHAKAKDEFKFRTGIGEGDAKWKVQIQQPDPDPESVTGWKDLGNLLVEDYWEATANPKTMEVDLSDAAEFRWTPSSGEGIENIQLTEKAQKVVVDGVIYIIRDNKMYNIHGAQVR